MRKASQHPETVSSYNPMQMVGAAFTHSTSDFGNILLDVANKAILQGWEDAPETYEQWTRKGQLTNSGSDPLVGVVWADAGTSAEEVPVKLNV
ncbi:hypothetical protein GR261_19965 [Escherichia coli]|nr:hypothetical protein [Escherichia coli]EFI6444680.1 hypothetical protein [Escherichia coli]